MSTNEERAREALKVLSVPEKLQLVQDLWDEIARSPQEIQLTSDQREELERRLRKHESEPGEYISWEDLRRRLEDGQ